MTETTRTLKGMLYRTHQNGYSQPQLTSITFPAKINYLSIHSRCNELLKWDDQQKNKLSHQIEQIHCSSLSESKKNNLSLPKEQVKHSLTLLKKSLKIEDKQDQLAQTRHKPSFPERDLGYFTHRNQTKTQNDNSSPNEDLPSFMTDTKPVSREAELLRELQRQQSRRIQVEKQYNAFLKKSIKARLKMSQKREKDQNKFEELQKQTCKEDSLMGIVNKDSLVGLTNKINSLAESEQRLRVKIVTDGDEEQMYDGHDDLTVLPKYNKNEGPRKAEDSIKTYRKEYNEFSTGIYEQIANIYDKLTEMDVNMQVRQEKIKRELIEKQILEKQNSGKNAKDKKKKMKMKVKATERELGENEYASLNYFIIFVLGLLFTKAFLC